MIPNGNNKSIFIKTVKGSKKAIDKELFAQELVISIENETRLLDISTLEKTPKNSEKKYIVRYKNIKYLLLHLTKYIGMIKRNMKANKKAIFKSKENKNEFTISPNLLYIGCEFL